MPCIPQPNSQKIEGGGHYLLVVRRNQHALYDEITALFDELPFCNHHKQELWQYAFTTSEDSGHGRRQHYLLESATAFNGYVTFPAVA